MHPSDFVHLHLQDHRERVAVSLERHGFATSGEQRPSGARGRPPEPQEPVPTTAPLGIAIR